ncbi:regulatory protein TetR [Mycolicibacterium rhodesiae JS60]|nr:regulatory protein TetR [Mycolicibacterium rhodesiae JS60]
MLLLATGYTGFSVKDVAERSGTTKAAIYRRWATKAELVHAVAFASVPSALPPASRSGTEEVRALLRVSRQLFSDPVIRAALPHLITEVTATPTSTPVR